MCITITGVLSNFQGVVFIHKMMFDMFMVLLCNTYITIMIISVSVKLTIVAVLKMSSLLTHHLKFQHF